MNETMKDSGIDWVKSIPYTWSKIKVKHLATERYSLFLDGDWIESNVIEEVGIRYLTTGNVGIGVYKKQGSGYISTKTFKDLKCLKVIPQDLMISRLNEPIGRACIVPDDEAYYVVAVDNVILRPNKNFNKKFLMYVMNTDGYAENGNIIARGATMSRISRAQLAQFWIAYPKLKKQILIANFLDKQCTKIDDIATDLEKQIDILQKYKKSLITETVTKGLDKSAPMKDSGIEWIGKIPTHWEVKRLKYVISVNSGYAITNDDLDSGEIPVFGGGKQMGFYYKNNVEASTNLVGRVGANCGCVTFVKQKSWATDNALIVSTKYNSLYIFYLLLSANLNKLNDANAQPLITGAKVNNCACAITLSEHEQSLIATFLDQKCSQIDSIIESKKEQLSKLQQHKKSLIYEYVTGKKRVKGEIENGN